MDVDVIHESEWEDVKDKMRQEKIPLLLLEGENQDKAIQACRIQDMLGEYYVWKSPVEAQTQRSVRCMNHIGSKGVIIGDVKVWTNCKAIEKGLRGEIRRRNWKERMAVKSKAGKRWREIIEEGTLRNWTREKR